MASTRPSALQQARRRRWGHVALLLSLAVEAGVLVWLAGWPTPVPQPERALAAQVIGVLLLGTLVWLMFTPGTLPVRQRAGEPPESDLLALSASARLVLDKAGVLQRIEFPGEQHPLSALDGATGQRLWEIEGVQFESHMLARLREALRSGRAWGNVHWCWLDDTERKWFFSSRALPITGSGGEVRGYVVVLRDRSAEARLRELFQRLQYPLILHQGGRIIDANPAAVALFGLRDLPSLLATDLLGHFKPGPSLDRARQQFRATLDNPQGVAGTPGDYELLTGGPEPRIVQMTCVRADGNSGPSTLSMLTDETERRQAEQAVLRSETLLSHLVATSPDVITLTDLDTGRYAMVNPTFCRLTGHSAKDVIGKTALELGIWAHLEDRERMVKAIRDTGTLQDMSTVFIGRAGQQLPMLVSAARFSMDGRNYLVINARDVSETEQMRLEYEAIVENALIGIALTRDQHFQMTNPKFDAMLGWPQGSLAGQHGSVVWPSTEAHAEVGRLVGARLSAGEQIEFEKPMRRRDGSEFLCRLLARAVNPTHPSRGGTIWLAEDITERRQVDLALARARDEAEAANRAKSAFLANTSHEIRTPLNALLGLARLARRPEVDELRRREYIEQISESARTLSSIISDILDLSKIEAGKMHLDNQPFVLDAMLQSLHQAYGALADAKGLTMSLQVDEDLPGVVIGDPVRLRQILSNYLNNALKFTDTGSIRLRVAHGQGHLLRFDVIDTGAGISPDSLAQLFQPFSQVDVSITRRIGGTGLGLSICRQLAELMGGSVGVASEPGIGSCFWAELPLPEGDQAELEATTGSDGLDPIIGARVLMAEDNPVNMMIAVALLEQWEADVTQATDGGEAVLAVDKALAEGRPFDVVLMDVQMPGLSGHDATIELRRRHSAQELPIIALTAAALVSERDRALAAGMNDFLTKPIDAQRLRRTLVRTLRHAARLAEEAQGLPGSPD